MRVQYPKRLAIGVYRKSLRGNQMTRKERIIANIMAWIAMFIVTLVFVNESLNILAN
jgi:hypothetical protein